MPQISKKGALSVSAALDEIATLFQTDFTDLGVPQKLAQDFARRCDMLSDHVEKRAGIERVALTGDDPVKEKGFDPEEIGKEVAGPMEQVDKDESYMKGEFTQQENRELRTQVESGALGMKVNPEPKSPSPGKQAAALQRQLQAAVIEGASPRVLKALALAARVAEEDEKPDFLKEKEEKKDDKKAGEMPPQFKENAEKKKEEAEGKKDDKEEKKDDGKKASHRFNLYSE